MSKLTNNLSGLGLTLAASMFAFTAVVEAAPGDELKPTIKQSGNRIATKPLKDIAKIYPPIAPSKAQKLKASGEKVPGDGNDIVVPNQPFPFDIERNRSLMTPQTDGALQSRIPSKQIPDPAVSFDGMRNPMGYVPPDTNGDIGPNHYVQTVNTAIAVYDRTGTQLLAPTAINSLWAGLGGLCETTNRGDPVVLYDKAADRWMVSQFAFNDSMTDNRQCIAISQTGDPLGAYYAYDFEFSNTLFNDYPKFGIWEDGYYMSVNQFGSGYEGVAVVAYEREAMLAGAAAQQVKFDLGSSFPSLFALQPAHHTGVLAAPAGTPNYFFAVEDDWFHGAAQDQVSIFEFDVDWTTPANSSFTLAETMPVASFDMNIETAEIVQPNGITLDSLRGFAMYRLNYRNLGDRGALVVNHSVDADSAGQAGIRWYEISVDNTTGSISLAQQGTYAPADGVDRWMGSAAMDATGNIAIGFSATSNTIHPSVHYAGRLSTDPAGELTQGEGIIVTGTGSQGSVNRSRWADYSSLSVDPVDDCTFWYTTEYYTAGDNNSLTWSTRVGAFKFDNCTALPTGVLSGTVTDSASGDPIANLRVSVGTVSTRTDAEGNYAIRLPVDTYDVTFNSYWYQEGTGTGLAVAEDETTDFDIALSLAPTTTVAGTVTEGGDFGWPIYSKVTVTVPEGPAVETYSNPITGAYSVELVADVAVPFDVMPIGFSGISDANETVMPAELTKGPLDQNFSLPVDLASCSAPGYSGYSTPGVSQNFDGDFLTEGWTTVDLNGNGGTWTSTNGTSWGNRTGGTGHAAIIDSDGAGSITLDSALVSPVITVPADFTSVKLNYLANFQSWSNADNFDLEISVDGGAWQTVLAWTGDHGVFAGPGEAVQAELVSFLSGATSFQVRFHYYNANYEWWAQVDDVQITFDDCAQIPGTLYAGFVTDANTDLALNGVAIAGANSTVSVATTADANIPDGLYFLFEEDTTTELSASLSGYETAAQAVAPVANMLVQQDIALNAPMFAANPAELSVTQTAGRSMTEALSIDNDGTASGEFSSYFVKGDSTKLQHGPFHPSGRHFGPKNLQDSNVANIRYFSSESITQLTPGEAYGAFGTDLDSGWGVSINRDNGEFFISDLNSQTIVRFNSNYEQTTDVIDADFGGAWTADSAFNQRTGMLWNVNVGGDNCIHEVDTVALAATGNKICPAFGISQRGLAYDPVTDTFYAGSWNDSLIHQFTTDGAILRSVNVGLNVAGLAYNSETGHLFVSVAGGGAPGEFDLVVLNAWSSELVKIGGYDIYYDTGSDVVDVVLGGAAGLDIDCDGVLWMVDQYEQYVIAIDSGETGACEWNNVPWLSLSSSAGSVAAGESASIDVTFDSAGLTAGDYSATLIYGNDSPYGSVSVPVSMSLTPPSFGTTQFAVTSVDVNEGGEAEITLTRTGGSDFAVSVDFATMDGSATAGVDYTAASGTVSWADMDTATKTITVDTNQLDAHKTFTIVLSNVQGGATMGASSSMVVTIKDQPEGSGAFGGLVVAFLSLLAVFRRRQMMK